VIERAPSDDRLGVVFPDAALWSAHAAVGLDLGLFGGTSLRAQLASPGHQTPTCDAAAWMLDPWWLNRQVIRRDTIVLPQWSDARPYLPSPFDGAVRRRYPIAIDPPHIARRIAVQQSRFTIHGTAPDGIELLGQRRGSRLQKLVINKRAIVKIRKDLYTAGITDTTVFPDLEGLSQELTRYFTDDW
jgi:hypothetical protein